MAARKKTAKKKTRKKMGRPRFVVDWNLIDQMAAIHCTGPEIASVLGVCEDTMTNAAKREKGVTFSEYLKEKRGTGKVSLRRRQWKAAEAGDRVMLIWLGKQWLGQRQEPETENARVESGEYVVRIRRKGDDGEGDGDE